jgi:acetyl-CoA carboxylase biotin carboxyl carrier protein
LQQLLVLQEEGDIIMGKTKDVVIGGKDKLTLKDIKQIISVLRRNNVSEFDLEQNGMRLRIITGANDRTKKPVESYIPQIVPNPVSSIVPMVSGNLGTAEGTPAAAEPAKEAVSEREDEKEVAAPEGQENYVRIKSPMVGTFYRAPSPDAPPYVEPGDEIKEDTVLCIVEAMKLMNEIKAEMRGKIIEILVENGQPVEYGQPLFLVEPM